MDEKKALEISDKLFSVVHFLELPHDDINKTVCVPRRWGDAKGKNIMRHIKYPIEDAYQTEIRVRKQEKPSKDWGTYEVVELAVVGSYEDAESEIAKRNKRETAKKKKYASKVKDTKKLGTTMKAQTKKRNITKEKMHENVELAKKYQLLFGGEDDPKTTKTQTNFNEGYSTSNNTHNHRTNGQAYCCKEYPGVFSNPWHNQNCFYKPRLTEGFKIYINGIDVNTYPHISVHIVPTIIEPCNHNNLAQIPPQYCQNFNHLPSGLFIPGPSTQPVFNQGIRVRSQINEENNSQMRKDPSSGQMTEKTNNRNSSYTQTENDSNVSQQVQTNRTSNSESQTESCATNIVTEKTNNRNSSYTQTDIDSNVSQKIQTNKTSNSESQTESCATDIVTEKTNNRKRSYTQTENDSNVSQQVQTNKSSNSESQTGSFATNIVTEKTNNRNSSYTQTENDSNVSQQVQTNKSSNSESQTGSFATNIVTEKTNNRNSSYTQTENDSNVSQHSQQVQTNKTSNSESQTGSCFSPILTDKTNNSNSSQTENDSNQISEKAIQNKRKNKSHTASASTTSTEFNSRQNPENGTNNGERRSETPVNRQQSTDKISSQTPTPLNSNPLQSQSNTSHPTVRKNIPDNTKNKLPHQRRISSNMTPIEQTQYLYISRSSTSQAVINISRNSEEQIRRNEGNKLPMHGQYYSNKQTDKHVPSSRYNTHAPPVLRVENNRNSEKGPTERKSYSTLPSHASETQANLSPRPVERERDTCNPQFRIHDTTIRQLGSNNKRKSSGVEPQTCDPKRVQIVARAQPTNHAGQVTNTNTRPLFPPPLIEIPYSPRLKVNGQPLSENRHSNQRKDVHEKANEQSHMHVQNHCNVNQKEVQGNAGENNSIRIVNSFSVSSDRNGHYNHEETPPPSIPLDLQNYRTMGRNLFSLLERQIYKRT
ncbi:putative uncharacterized protein DDB_G0286901 isoform X3 [Colias croceus]|uniref:putative uncharacterized protein DDB_G0286901 isoform X3 n=1 Tax=Colias crocea TaxID=72248 RepID=UPI001E27D80A|nr:putative uncharacterized protein DDB_G0286901 isoform X3 [Colias croceus]